MNTLLLQSKTLLLKFLREPWWFSFFPSSFFWNDRLSQKDIRWVFIWFFSGPYCDIKNENNKINLYIHIPFCSRICSYCNCFKTFLNKESQIDQYLDYLDKEANLLVSLNNNKKININTIFIGGWTPNLLSVTQFETLFSMIKRYFNISSLEQFIVDCHPNFLDKDKIDLFHKNWVNRVTIAIQTLDADVLSKNNRDSYDVEKIKTTIALLKKCWIKINIDILIWMNGQTIDSIKKDMDFFMELWVDNISDHYVAISNNMNYHLDKDYENIFSAAKEYIAGIKISNTSENLQESYFTSKRASTLSLWAEGVTNIFAWAIYKKPGVDRYYEQLSVWEMPVQKWILLDLKQEMIKYVYLNIFSWVNVIVFQELFGANIFEIFRKEVEFLLKKRIIKQLGDRLHSNCRDIDMYIYLNTLFIVPYLWKKIPNIWGSINESDFSLYFDTDGNRIDE